MIDDPFKTTRLFARLRESLPVHAKVTRTLFRELRRRSPEPRLPWQCEITAVHYLGDPGGIVCRLDFGLGETKEEYIVSITHLSFDRRSPLSREIAAYQKRRLRKLRRLDDLAA